MERVKEGFTMKKQQESQKIEITLRKEKHMIVSEWVIFGISVFLILSFVFSSVQYISKLESDFKIIALIVLIMVFSKLLGWLRLPTTYSMEDIVQEIDYIMEKRK